MSTVSEAAGRAYGGESAADRDDRRQRQLLDAGLRVFGSIGYRAATVRGLCREAKIADRHFYQYFDKTEDLLLAVYAECIAHLTNSVSEAIVQVDRDADLRAVTEQLLEPFFRVVEDPHLARVVWMEVLGVSPRVEQTYLTVMQQFGTLLLGYLRTFAGDVPSGPEARRGPARHRCHRSNQPHRHDLVPERLRRGSPHRRRHDRDHARQYRRAAANVESDHQRGQVFSKLGSMLCMYPVSSRSRIPQSRYC